MLAFLNRLWPFGSNELGNAGDVFEAIAERSDFGYGHVGVLGEPDLVDRGGNYTTDLHVVVPLFTEDGEPSPANLEYDLPDGLEDAEAHFYEILEIFGIYDLSRLGEIEGKNIPLGFEDGTLVPLWNEVLETDNSEE